MAEVFQQHQQGNKSIQSNYIIVVQVIIRQEIIEDYDDDGMDIIDDPREGENPVGQGHRQCSAHGGNNY